jgi:hypothetical protein
MWCYLHRAGGTARQRVAPLPTDRPLASVHLEPAAFVAAPLRRPDRRAASRFLSRSYASWRRPARASGLTALPTVAPRVTPIMKWLTIHQVTGLGFSPPQAAAFYGVR